MYYEWVLENTTSVGNVTQYSTNCLQPGQLYYFELNADVSLTDPDEIINVYLSMGLLTMGKYLHILSISKKVF